VVLGAVFMTEAVVMVALPWVLPADPPRILEATVDAVLLTVVVAPLLWGLLVRPLREANRVRADFLADLFASIEADRRQTAHDLHDGVGQSLTLLVSGLRSAIPGVSDPDVARRYLEFKQLARQALADVKRVALGLRPSLLDDLGLAPALERLAVDVRANHPVEVTLDVLAVEDVRLPSAVETTLFRIAQEALANVVAHATAAHATITVRRRGSTVELDVTDDGVGIPPAILNGRNPGHLGLTGMRERATLQGGELTIHSSPGSGTRLSVRLPVEGA